MIEKVEEFSRDILKNKFESSKNVNPREAAELAYALSILYAKRGDRSEAVHFARESITLFDTHGGDDYFVHHANIAGVSMPSTFIHSDVVREHLKFFGITIENEENVTV
ncbi:MAG: hypothetical protein WCS86_01450 [Candidatus Paceibacterota bacterium]